MPEANRHGGEAVGVAPLVDADWLAARLGAADLRILDIRSVVDGGGAGAFLAAHVPGAVHTDYTKDGWRAVRGLVTGLLPDAEALAALFGRLGIAPGQHVVVVGAGNGAADFSAAAARVYWTLKTAGHRAVSILDGGMAVWMADPGRPVEGGPGLLPTSTRHPVSFDLSWRCDVGGVERAMAAGDAVLLDSRSADFFRGIKKSPQAVRPGRIPRCAQPGLHLGLRCRRSSAAAGGDRGPVRRHSRWADRQLLQHGPAGRRQLVHHIGTYGPPGRHPV